MCWKTVEQMKLWVDGNNVENSVIAANLAL